MKGLKL